MPMSEEEALRLLMDDDVGYDDDDDDVGYEEIGARRRRRAAPRRNLMFGPSESIGRLAPLGTGAPVSIGAGLSNTFTATVQRPAHVRRLLVTSSGAVQELSITDLEMGDTNQLLTGEVPASLYDINAQQGFPDDFTVLKANATFRCTIRNNGIGAASVAVGAKAQVNR